MKAIANFFKRLFGVVRRLRGKIAKLAAKIAKHALANELPLIDVAVEMTDLSRGELEKLLDPQKLCGPSEY